MISGATEDGGLNLVIHLDNTRTLSMAEKNEYCHVNASDFPKINNVAHVSSRKANKGGNLGPHRELNAST